MHIKLSGTFTTVDFSCGHCLQNAKFVQIITTYVLATLWCLPCPYIWFNLFGSTCQKNELLESVIVSRVHPFSAQIVFGGIALFKLILEKN